MKVEIDFKKSLEHRGLGDFNELVSAEEHLGQYS